MRVSVFICVLGPATRVLYRELTRAAISFTHRAIISLQVEWERRPVFRAPSTGDFLPSVRFFWVQGGQWRRGPHPAM